MIVIDMVHPCCKVTLALFEEHSEKPLVASIQFTVCEIFSLINSELGAM